MKKESKNGVEYLTFNIFNQYDFLEHGFSTKNGGVSKGYYSSMNLRLNCNDALENIEKNFKIFLNLFNLSKKNTVLTNQVHEKHIVNVTEYRENNEPSDGLVTSLEEIGLMTFHADCIPVFFADTKKRVIGLVHSGWRGTYEGISVEMIDLILEKYESNLENIIVGIGPGIEECCYEVGAEIYELFNDKSNEYADYFIKKSNKYMLDLKGIIKFDLMNKGILEENIEISNLCTMCNMDMFFSHRGQGLKRGGMAAVIKKVR